MYYEAWVDGCRVTVSEWYGKGKDGLTPLRIGVEYFRPGANINKPPEWERRVIVSGSEAETVKNKLHSIATSIIYGKIGV